ncbi:hypothetical protein FB45DRAFT_908153 [Roridomyces roridus]|uniref:RBR-type E3 ubiquitin transferase n=1 Tax=Roridomyces roridus TaxID=1738132 RepID=A0AAD7C2F5_9AGAR|nr:hypothetical protein FB45DRAFT_908153 [Roridomyces roridus]
MGNCMTNAGSFEPPGQAAVGRFMEALDDQTDPTKIALRVARERAAAAERRVSADPTSVGPKCSVCFKHCQPVINPFQSARIQRMMADVSDESDASDSEIEEVPVDGGPRKKHTAPKTVLHGIQLTSCKHYFCGPCLAQAIYNRLHVVFDPEMYGTTLPPSVPITPGGRADFPVSCPTCQVKPGEQPVEISDVTAKLVLGDTNMNDWNHARFLSTLNLIYCPHKGCDESFDANDIAPAPSGVEHAQTLVQCPRCRKTLCTSCKSVWHDKLTCEQYQALPVDERNPEDVAFANLAKQEKWRRCPKCSAMVELKFGCNHITCVCQHHFCYTCGADFEHKGGRYRCKGGLGCKVWEEQNLLARD